MNNIIVGLLLLAITFSLVVVIEKLFKKDGLFVWISIALIMANILECKTIGLLNFTSTTGNVLYASIFLAIDIMIEKYESKYAKKAIKIAAVSMISFIVLIQISLLFIPDEKDTATEAMKILFDLNLRISAANIFIFYISSLLNIRLFDKFKIKYPNKLWLRNNVSTIASNVLEKFLFVFIAFEDFFDISTLFNMAVTVAVLVIIIALLDTPFIYLSKKLK